MELADHFGRKMTYLRIGVTDRCNLRCRYCMPEEGIDFSRRKDPLNYEEILSLSKIFRRSGVEKVRITGGEPFVRKDIEVLLSGLREIFPVLHVTTNATLLAHYIDFLKEIEVDGLNISLDTLDRNTFQLITRRDSFETVMDNILQSLQKGIKVKINMVVMKGINDKEIPAFIHFADRHHVEVRFIETMPFNQFDGNRELFMPAGDILKVIKSSFADTRELKITDNSSSIRYLIDNRNKVGIIPAYSRSLCGSCNRIRLTPKGELLTCLYAEHGVQLLPLIRDMNLTEDELLSVISHAVSNKKENGFLEEEDRNDSIFRSMTTIGG